MEDTEKDLSRILKRVQVLITVASGSNHNPPDSPEWHALNTEQNVARKMADDLMLEYAIEEADAMAKMAPHERIRPMSDTFESVTGDLAHGVDMLADIVSRFTRTRIRRYAHYDYERSMYVHRIYGYESDVRYFQILYTQLRLHFLGALQPEINPSLSLEENCYNLHMAGFGWREIAKMYGWRTEPIRRGKDPETWYSPEGVMWEGEARFAVRPFRLAYWRECKKRGEEPLRHISPMSFRLEAINGYVTTIRKRIREVEESRKIEGGSGLAIRIEDLEQFIREESGCVKCPACGLFSLYDYKCSECGNETGMPGTKPEDYVPCPKCQASRRGYCNEHSMHGGGRYRTRKYSAAGYAAGVRQGQSADLGGQRTSAPATKSIS